MGCISSKIMSRSMSFQEELNQRMQRSTNHNPALKELAISANINDQFLALVHTTNTVAITLRSGKFSNKCPKPAFEPNITPTSRNTWECMSSPEEGEAKQVEPEASMLLPQILADDLSKRSRSCRWLPEIEMPSPSLESFDGTKDDKWNHKNVGRARSFHTVEEYDALIEKIRLFEAQVVSNGEADGLITKAQLNHSQSSSYASQHDGDSYGSKEVQQSHFKDEASLEENSKIEYISTLSSSELESAKHNPNPNRSGATKELSIVNNSPPEGHILQKGFKRKSIANALESLEIPQTIEFQAVASLREWLHVDGQGQVYSPGAYITPKFGSYSLPSTGTANECNERVIFNPELVTACEECMQQLEVEAESILRQIAENLEEENVMEKQARDDI